MYSFLVRRLLTVIVLPWLLTVLIFALGSATGVGVERLFPIHSVSPFDVARETSMYGIDRSPAEQYFVWLGQILRGNFGASKGPYGMDTEVSIGYMLIPQLVASFLLTGAGLLIIVVSGVVLGVFTAVKPRHWVTRAVNHLIILNPPGSRWPSTACGI